MSKAFRRAGSFALFAVVAMSSVAYGLDTDVERRTAEINAMSNALHPSGQQAIQIVGTQHLEKIADEINALVIAKHPRLSFANQLKGANGAVPMISHGRALLAVMDRPITRFERVPYQKYVGSEPVQFRVAHSVGSDFENVETSEAVYVNRANPLEKLSVSQLERMLRVGNDAGDFSRWGQVGLEGEWSTRIIRAYGPSEHSSFGTRFFKGMTLSPGYESYDKTEAVVDRLSEDPAGVAVAKVGLTDPRIKQVAILDPSTGNPTTGTADEIRQGRYPFGVYLYINVRKLPGQPIDPIAQAYIRVVLSPEGQGVFAKARGYEPLTDVQVNQQLQVLKEASLP